MGFSEFMLFATAANIKKEKEEAKKQEAKKKKAAK